MKGIFSYNNQRLEIIEKSPTGEIHDFQGALG